MSLDVCLTMNGSKNKQEGSGIFIRENGETKEITRVEWDEKFPGREPFLVEPQSDTEYVYSANITHNLGKMADEAGIYQALWRPEEINITKAKELVEPLTTGLKTLKNDPERFKKLNPSNGWGSYDSLLTFVEDYLNACVKFPEAEVSTSR